MSEKRTETYWYDEEGNLTKKEVKTEDAVTTQWYPYPIPAYRPYWDTNPVWWNHPVVSFSDVRDVVDPYHG